MFYPTISAELPLHPRFVTANDIGVEGWRMGVADRLELDDVLLGVPRKGGKVRRKDMKEGRKKEATMTV